MADDDRTSADGYQFRIVEDLEESRRVLSDLSDKLGPASMLAKIECSAADRDRILAAAEPEPGANPAFLAIQIEVNPYMPDGCGLLKDAGGQLLGTFGPTGIYWLPPHYRMVRLIGNAF